MQMRWVITGLVLLMTVTVLQAQSKDGTSNPTLPDDVLAAAGISAEQTRIVLEESFDAPDAWETYSDETGSLRVDDGRYIITYSEAETIMWGQNQLPHDDVIIRVETTQLSTEDDNGYGVMCRADAANTLNGYHLLISGDGYASIVLVTDDDTAMLADWERAPAINTGQASNEIIAVCSGSTIALWVNGERVAQVTDDTYSRGVTGFSAVTFVAGTTVEIAYDNLVIREIEAPQIGLTGGRLRGLSSDPEALTTQINAQLEQGNLAITGGELLVDEPFDSETAWEYYKDDVSSASVQDGRYLISAPDLMWGQNRTITADSIIYVQTEQQSAGLNNGYGVICRADPANNLNGYHFYISGDGYWAIYLRDDRLEETLVPLLDWAASEAIQLGQSVNTMTAVCVGDYLALYANGQLLGETRDTTYATGATGLIALSFIDGQQVTVTFDNLRIWDISAP